MPAVARGTLQPAVATVTQAPCQREAPRHTLPAAGDATRASSAASRGKSARYARRIIVRRAHRTAATIRAPISPLASPAATLNRKSRQPASVQSREQEVPAAIAGESRPCD